MLMHRRKVSNSFRGGRKYSISFSFFQFILEINEKSSNNRVKNVAKLFVLLLNKQLRLMRKMLMIFRKVEEVIMKPGSL